MPVLDMKEIPVAHIASGKQDTFEMFARDFLEFMGYGIVSHPDRGPDGGKDLLVEEIRTGVGGESKVRWLVSCKHKATSGASVSATDDGNIHDRVLANKCQGFIGFYSTIVSSGLNTILSGLPIEVQTYDHERIEGQLLHSAAGLKIAQRYFPLSLSKWTINNPQPAKVFRDSPHLNCVICSKDLLTQEDKGIVTLWQRLGTLGEPRKTETLHIHWSCRGRCDSILREHMHRQKMIDGWEDISDVMTPTIYAKWVMTIMNQLRDGDTYSDEAFNSVKEFLLQLFPYVARHPSSTEEERIRTLSMVPAFMGGLGYDD
jgi:Restriction endonuclease